MGFFKYPYTDLNELNLDWVIAKIKYIEQAKNIIYNNSGTQLISNNVQDALTEIFNLISTQGVTSFNARVGNVVPEAGDYEALQVTYDNSGSGLLASETQAAIDEVNAKIPASIVETFNSRSGAVAPTAGDYDAGQITYDNTVSGLAATDTQAAIDELAAAPGGVTSFNTRTGAVVPAASDYDAVQVDFDDTVAQTGSSNVQGALEYVATRGASAQYTTYNNTQSGLSATNVQAAIDEVAQDVLSSGVASFNGRTGAVNPAVGDYDLTDLGDVNISTPANDEVLKYDSVSQKWVNGAGGGGASTLGGLTDVTLTTPVSGDQLTYNGSDWVNTTAPSIPSDLDDLSDVTITSPTSGEGLVFDGSGWVNSPVTVPSGKMYVQDVTLTTNAGGAALQYNNMLYDLATQAVALFATLGNDESLEIKYLELNTTRLGSLSGRLYTNADTSFVEEFFSSIWGPSTFRCFEANVRNTSAGVNFFCSQSITTANVITVTNNSTTTYSYPCRLVFRKYKNI